MTTLTEMLETSELADVLDDTHVVMVCGSGGVGKTSVAASLAITECLRGRDVCVLTIDPARRLADALGVDQLDDTIREVDLTDVEPGAGALHALMLDPKKSFDRFIEETSDDDATRDRILANRIYREVSQHASSVQEYMAIERLYELDRNARYDIIIVDTPPMAHARDLIDAPDAMRQFFQGKSLQFFLKPSMRLGGFGLKAVGGSGGLLVKALTKLTGAEAIRDLTEFFEALAGLVDTIGERIDVVERMMGEESTGFMVVTSPERESVDDAHDFWLTLADRGYGYVATVVNRVEPLRSATARRAGDLVGIDHIDDNLARRLLRCWRDHQLIARRDASRIDELRGNTTGSLLATIPRMTDLEASIDGLLELSAHMYEAE